MYFEVIGMPQGKARARTFYNPKLGKHQSITPDKTVLYENLIKTSFMAAENKKKASVSLENVAEVFAESYGPLFNRFVYLTCVMYALYIYHDRFTRYRLEGLSLSETLGTLFSNTMLSMMLAGCVMICLLFVLSPIIAIRRRRIMKSIRTFL